MEVSVKLFASLRRYRPDLGLGQALTCQLAEPATLADLTERVLGLAPGEAAILLVNGRPQPRDYVLRGGDRVSLWPPVAGGAR
jgi:molybdopterin converting factor small subunit